MSASSRSPFTFNHLLLIGALCFGAGTHVSKAQEQPPAATGGTSASVGQAAGSPAAATGPNSPAQLRITIDAYKAKLADFPELSRYRDENLRVLVPAAGERRVIFFGDSITDSWGHDPKKFFPGHPFLNRGIRGQTTAQMLLRFRPDVIDLHPAAVVILAGTNDIADMTDARTLQAVEDNYQSMAELAQLNQIRPIFSTVLPICGAQIPRRSPDNIRALNAWLRRYTQDHGYSFVDYYSVMLDPATGQLKVSLTRDCLHPNSDGYRVMEPLVEQGIDAALAVPIRSR